MKTIQEALDYLNATFGEGELDLNNTRRVIVEYVYGELIDAHPETEIMPVEEQMNTFPDFHDHLVRIVQIIVEWGLSDMVDDIVTSKAA